MAGLNQLPESIATEEELDELLSRPSPELIGMMRRLDGDMIVLGIGGKMGITLGLAAVRAARDADTAKRVIGVSRFSNASVRQYLENRGVETIACDLLDRQAVGALPKIKNVIYMVGRKFGTQGHEDLTWATNVVAPDNVGHHFKKSRIVVFSTGCVYPLVPV
jgi:nucleoside-diphosphate-sugar epimerase